MARGSAFSSVNRNIVRPYGEDDVAVIQTGQPSGTPVEALKSLDELWAA